MRAEKILAQRLGDSKLDILFAHRIVQEIDSCDFPRFCAPISAGVYPRIFTRAQFLPGRVQEFASLIGACARWIGHCGNRSYFCVLPKTVKIGDGLSHCPTFDINITVDKVVLPISEDRKS